MLRYCVGNRQGSLEPRKCIGFGLDTVVKPLRRAQEVRLYDILEVLGTNHHMSSVKQGCSILFRKMSRSSYLTYKPGVTPLKTAVNASTDCHLSPQALGSLSKATPHFPDHAHIWRERLFFCFNASITPNASV